MMERTRLKRGLSASALSAALVAFGTLGGCGVLDTTPEKPAQARVQVDVTSATPVQLVVSTDFFELVDQLTGEILASLNASDTFTVTSSFDQTFDLSDLGSVLARLTETENDVASIRMRVFIDGSLEYDRTGTLQDATIEYRYVFNNVTF